MREERIAHLLRALPKALRRPLMPLHLAAREIAEHVPLSGGHYVEAMSAFVRRKYGVEIPPAEWPVQALPDHLRPRLRIVSTDGETLVAGRDLAALRERVRNHQTPAEADAWQRAAQQWERHAIREWDFGDLPEAITIADIGGFPLRAYPGLQAEEGDSQLRLFRMAEEASAATRSAVPRLAERVLHRELTALQKDLRRLRAHGVLHVTLGPVDELLETAWQNLRRHLLHEPEPPPRTRAAFEAYLAAVRGRLPGLAARLDGLVGAILEKRQEVLMCRRPFASLPAELNALVPLRFLVATPFETLPHLPRYLEALLIRAERAALNPLKDAEKAQRVAPYAATLRELAAAATRSPAGRAAWHRLRWLVEEYKVSVFAPELGTSEKVAPRRLDEVVAALRRVTGAHEGRAHC